MWTFLHSKAHIYYCTARTWIHVISPTTNAQKQLTFCSQYTQFHNDCDSKSSLHDTWIWPQATRTCTMATAFSHLSRVLDKCCKWTMELVLIGRMPFLLPNQQCWSTEGNSRTGANQRISSLHLMLGLSPTDSTGKGCCCHYTDCPTPIPRLVNYTA